MKVADDSQSIDIMRDFFSQSQWSRENFLVCILLESVSKVRGSAMSIIYGKGRGLTILELVITMAIVAVLTALMIPGLGNWLSHHRIKGAARSIASCFRQAQMTAVQDNQACTIRFDPNNQNVRVLDNTGTVMKTLDLEDYRAQFNGFDFLDVDGDNLIEIEYDTRGIPRDENDEPIATPAGQNGQRVFLINGRGERYWVELTPVGNVRFDRA
jgi:Tfp pilus assembly protein FimT